MTEVQINVGMLIASGLMAFFALCSLITASIQAKSQKKLLKDQIKSQETLLNVQNDIQQKQLKLALLKEKQEIRELFRRLIIEQRKKFEAVLYRCETIGIDEFREHMSKNYIIVMRMRDLFGASFEQDVKKMILEFEKIISWETNRISELRLFERGLVHPNIEKTIPTSELEHYRETHRNNVSSLLRADEMFAEILNKLTSDIDKIAKEFQSVAPRPKWEQEMDEFMQKHFVNKQCFRFKYFWKRVIAFLNKRSRRTK